MAPHRRRKTRAERAVTGLTKFELQTHARGDGASALERARIGHLGQIHELAIAAEVGREQLRMTIEAETANYEAIEVAQQKVGEIERAELGLGQTLENRRRGEELIAVRARDALDAFLAQHAVELAAGTAVAVGDEDGPVVLTRCADQFADGAGDPLGPVVQLRRKAAHVQLRPAVGATQCRDLARQRAAGDDQRALAILRHRATGAQRASATARRFAISPFAVSTATAASRQ